MKCIARIVNTKDFGVALEALLKGYNSKPFLTGTCSWLFAICTRLIAVSSTLSSSPSFPLRLPAHSHSIRLFVGPRAHTFYCGNRLVEVDINFHRFQYLARKGMFAFRDYIPSLVCNLAFVIEARDDDEQPERVLGALRIVRPSIDELISSFHDQSMSTSTDSATGGATDEQNSGHSEEKGEDFPFCHGLESVSVLPSSKDCLELASGESLMVQADV